MKATTSAWVPETAARVLRHWRSNSVAVLAPRQSMTAPVRPPRQLLPVVSRVLKKLSRFIPTTRVSPPTAGGLDGRGRGDGADAVGVGAGRVATPGVVEDTGQVGDGVATAQGVGRGQRRAASTEDDRVDVLGLGRVVEDDLAQVVGRLEGRGVGPRGDDVGRLLEAASLRERDLAEAAELEVLGDGHVLRERDEHALVALERRRAGHGEAHLGRGDRTGAADRDGGGADLGLALVLAGAARHGDDVTELDGIGVAALEDEDAVGRRGVAVALRVLEEEAAQGG